MSSHVMLQADMLSHASCCHKIQGEVYAVRELGVSTSRFLALAIYTFMKELIFYVVYMFITLPQTVMFSDQLGFSKIIEQLTIEQLLYN